MGYRDRTITFDFSELGDGCFVRLHNPKLLKADQLESPWPIKTGRDGQPVTEVDAANANRNGKRILVLLIEDWCVWDIDTDEALPVPDVEHLEVLDRIPVAILQPLMDEIGKALNPRPVDADGAPNASRAATTS